MEPNAATAEPEPPLEQLEPNASIELAQGRVRYRDRGEGRPIVFVHGLLVNGLLWRKVTARLEPEFRCIAPDWPLGSHSEPLAAGAEASPRGVANLIADFIEALSLSDVTLVANDTGGAIAQLLVTERPERIGRLVLTPCDAYENFLPLAFRPLQWAARVPGLLTGAFQAMRIPALRRSPLGFGMLTRRPIPDDVLAAWVRPYLRDAGVRRDTLRFLRAIDPRDTLAAAERLREFDRPTLLAWAPEDRFFKIEFARRLAGAFANARLETIPDSYTFVSEDQPARLAELIAGFIREGYSAGAEAGADEAGGASDAGASDAAASEAAASDAAAPDAAVSDGVADSAAAADGAGIHSGGSRPASTEPASGGK
jgi:pimeloyl-ACP methyl ester carboxylesterase